MNGRGLQQGVLSVDLGLFFENSWIFFFPKVFNLWLVEFVDAEPVDKRADCIHFAFQLIMDMA